MNGELNLIPKSWQITPPTQLFANTDTSGLLKRLRNRGMIIFSLILGFTLRWVTTQHP